MSSKEEILAKIKKNTGKRHEMPDLAFEAITYDDKWAAFSANLAAAGGQAVLLEAGQDIDEAIRALFPEARRIGSNLPEIHCATFNPDGLADPRELEGTDLAVVEGDFGVAENGAVWIPCTLKYKATYFISNALVILIRKERLVNNMNEAYHRVDGTDYAYGLFMSGPSKTADIEQALVFGAHGPIRVVVIAR